MSVCSFHTQEQNNNKKPRKYHVQKKIHRETDIYIMNDILYPRPFFIWASEKKQTYVCHQITGLWTFFCHI